MTRGDTKGFRCRLAAESFVEIKIGGGRRQEIQRSLASGNLSQKLPSNVPRVISTISAMIGTATATTAISR